MGKGKHLCDAVSTLNHVWHSDVRGQCALFYQIQERMENYKVVIVLAVENNLKADY